LSILNHDSEFITLFYILNEVSISSAGKKMIKQYSKTRIFIMLTVSLILAGALSRLVVAAPEITIDVTPNSAPVGSELTVSGEDASSRGEVRVYLSDSMFMASTEADGVGRYEINLIMPSLRGGTYDLMALDAVTGETSSTKLTIQPKIVLTPEEGSYGDSITVRGEGFQIFNPITITFNGSDVTPSPQPLPDGFGFFETEFRVPLVPNGTYIVIVDDGGASASASFAVMPKIALSPKTSGPVSTFILVIGTGFTPSVNVTIEFNSINVTNYGGVETWSDGSFGLWVSQQATFFIPDVPAGVYIINAIDETGNSATAPFVIPSPILTVTPNVTSGPSRISVAGSGFTPLEPILIYFEDILIVDLLDLMTGSQVLYADEYGTYEYSFIIPVAKPGVYAVKAHQLADSIEFVIGDELASASLTIIEGALLLDIKDEISTIIIPDLGIIKSNLTTINAKLVNIQEDMAIINSTLGTIKSNLTTIQAELINIEGTLATINSTLGTIQTETANIRLNITAINGDVAKIQTTLATMQGRITSIDGNIATIETDIGTIKAEMNTIEDNIGIVQGPQDTFTIPQYIITILSLIAAVCAVILTIMHVNVMRKTDS